MNPDLTTVEGVREVMERSRTESEWSDNCDAVKAANSDSYPSFWFMEIILSGLAKRTANKWGGDAEMKIVAL